MYPNNFFLPTQSMRYIPNGLNMFPTKTRGLLSSLKGINWSTLLSNAQKTLNVVNQTIPLVRQAAPMLNNMKSMIKLASAFKDETDTKQDNKKNIINNKEENNSISSIITNDINNNQPNFFI